MNYFAHGRTAIDEPYVLAGTAVPDWLGVADRRVRVPPNVVRRSTNHPDPLVAAVAKGIVRHHDDDAWFHVAPAFTSLCDNFRLRIESAPDPPNSHVASLVGHITIELLIDAWLIKNDPPALDRYFDVMHRVNPDAVAAAIETITGKPPHGLPRFIRVFCQEQFLRDYTDDDRLSYRMRQILDRTGLGSLSRSFADLLPEMRRDVCVQIDGLLPPS